MRRPGDSLHDVQPQTTQTVVRPGREAREHQLLLLFLVVVAAILCWARWASYQETEALERSRLAVQARAIEQNLTRQLSGVRAALRSTRADLMRWGAAERAQRLPARLQTLCVAIPGTLNLRWLDAQGQQQGSCAQPGSAATAAAASLAQEPWFRSIAAKPDAAVLYLSEPQTLDGGATVIHLSVALLNANGNFEGALVASLGADYFDTLLASVLYARDMWVAIVHAGGRVLVINPGIPAARGMNVAREGALFSRHMASGQVDSMLAGQAFPGRGGKRLAAQRTMSPPELAMDTALVLAATRDWDTMFGSWTRLNPVLAALYTAFAVAAWLALRAHQRQRANAETTRAQEFARGAAQAERLALALRGGDLALWDIDFRTGLGSVNERWFGMLGYERDQVPSDMSGWEALVHPEDRARVLTAYQAHVDGCTSAYEAEYRLQHKQGHWVWVLDRGRVVERDDSGKALRIVGTHMDITPRVQADEALRRSEESLSTTLYSIGDAVIATDPQGLVTRMNATAERLTGWPAAQAAGQPLQTVFRIHNARTREAVMDPVAVVLQSGEVVGLANDTVLVARDGQEHQVADSAAPIRAADGQIVGVVLVFSDVSENYRMVQALREREAQLALVTDMLPGPVARIGLDRRYRFANAAYRSWFGVEPKSLIGQTCADVLGDEIAALVFEPIGLALQGQAQRLDRVVPTQSGLRDVLVNLTPERGEAGEVRGVFMVVTDMTERKRAEQVLRLLEAAVAGLNDMVLITEAEPLEEPGPRILFVNAAFERYTGWKREEVLGKSPRFLRHPETDATELARVDAALLAGEAAQAELINQARDGRAYWVDIAIAPLKDASGRVTHFVSVHRDVADRRLAAAAVQEAQQELTATLAAVPDLLFDLDAEGLIHSYHSPRHDLLLIAPEQIIGRRAREVLPQEAADVVHQALEEAQRNGYSGGLQYQLALPTGPHWFELSVSLKAGSAGGTPRFIALARDVTERRQAETERLQLEGQLREAQKIESIGTLAGGIAHDFNNILAAILGNVALASGDLAADHAAQLSLEQIRKASLRARTLVQQILTFSRRQLNPLRVQPLQPVVEETLALLRATLPAAVRVETQLATQPLWLDADATQLQQVLMNLCTNAWHALPEHGGHISIGCEALDGGVSALAQDPDLAAQPVVHLWVRDDGCGMDAATRERIFDPFYTTKPVGQGTGLGLSVVHGIMRGHSGAVRVESTPGVGSTFHLYFPVAPAPTAEPGADETAGAAAAAGRGQQVLYVDDDDVMLLMVQRLLEREGYGVEVCGDARLALALVSARPRHFDLVISDYNMPECSGIDLAKQLLLLRPQLPVVISSGFITEELHQRAAALGVRALLNKERTLEELPALVRRILGD
jgi:PAS domain S-box-containing protein